MERGLAGTHAQGFEAPLEGGDASLEHVVGRVADPSVTVAFRLLVEQRCTVLGAVEGIRYGLVDRDSDSSRCRIDDISAMDGNGFVPHSDELPLH